MKVNSDRRIVTSSLLYLYFNWQVLVMISVVAQGFLMLGGIDYFGASSFHFPPLLCP